MLSFSASDNCLLFHHPVQQSILVLSLQSTPTHLNAFISDEALQSANRQFKITAANTRGAPGWTLATQPMT
jgi:hypothetical protein